MEKVPPREARVRPRGRDALVLAAAAVAIATVGAACGGSSSSSSASSATSAVESVAGGATSAASSAAGSAAATGGDKWAVKLKDGSTFKLAPRIKDKLDKKQPINYVFSYASSAIQGFSQQYKSGYDQSQAAAKQILPGMTFKAVAPSVPVSDIPQQTAEITALLNTNQLDCLSIEPANSDAFTQLTNQLLAQGIPVFTVGITTKGNELTNFTQEPNKEGHQAAQTVLDFMKANGKSFKTFAVSGGDPSQYWAQQRALGFRQGIMAAIPDAKFVTTETKFLNVTYDPAKTLDAYKAFLQGAGKDVDVIQNVDIGAGFAARAIDQSARKGKAYTVGWNVTPEQAEEIKTGTQIALFDQKWPEQGGFGAKACATFLATGKVLPNSQQLQVVTKANVDQVVADNKKLLGEG
jgi:ABC-type sugar transport system substrate-binding protein